MRGKWRSAVAVAAAAAWASLVLPAGAAASWEPGPAKYGVGKRANVPVTMSDGAVLRADVFFPTDESTGQRAQGSFPVLLSQTPYGKDITFLNGLPGAADLAGLGGNHPYLIQRGYVEVFVDVRGTGNSEGTWGLFDPIQGKDGAELAQWAAQLPSSNGKVGLIGASYLGVNQFMTVANLPKNSPVKAMFPIIPANDSYRDIVTQGGILDAEFGAIYLGLTGGLIALQPLLDSLANQVVNANLPTVLLQHLGTLLAFHAATLAEIETDGDKAYDGPYWQARAPQNMLRKVVANRVPAFMVGGWFDVFQRGEPLNYSGLQNLWAGRKATRPMTKTQEVTGRYQLLMGPWYHLTAGDGIDMGRLELRWFDRWLKGKQTAVEDTKRPLHVYDLGSNRYVDTSRYPFRRAKPTTYYAGPGGTLDRSKPDASGGSDTVLWTGLSIPCGRAVHQWSMGALVFLLGQAGGEDPCEEDDSLSQIGPGVVTYTTEPFTEPKVLAGPIGASLFASSTTPDAELVVRVQDIAPNGSSRPLTSGALLGSMRKLDQARTWLSPDGKPIMPYHPYTRESKQPLEPGDVTRFDVEVFPTFTELAPGHRLRLTIATSDIPHLIPNPQQLANLVGGEYAIQHNAAAASFVELPLAPAGSFIRPCSICE